MGGVVAASSGRGSAPPSEGCDNSLRKDNHSIFFLPSVSTFSRATHTWYIQKILNQLYSKPSAKISHDIAAESQRDILRENEFYYQTLLRIYTPSQRKLIKAISREGKVREITSGAFITKYGLTATSSVKGSLRKLLADEIVYHSLDGYMIYDRFFGQWLAMA